MFTARTQAHTYMAGYSAIPLRVYSDEALTENKFKYLINISTSSAVITGATTYSFLNDVFTKLSFSSAHDFKRGDSIMIDDSLNQDFYSNYYNVMSVVDSTSVIVNLTLGPAMTGSPIAHNVIKYKFTPDLEDEAKLDLSNTLKDFVTQNLSDSNELYPAPNTRMDYSLIMGSESIETFQFEDNVFVSGAVGFNNSTLPSTFTATTTFQIGDTIIIAQDLVQWDYYDNFFDSGELGFTGNTAHNFLTGQTVTITGQITQPAYNGPVQVRRVIDDYSFTTWKTFTTSTPAEAGIAVGIPRPGYNVSATITDIYWDAILGIVIVTNIGFQGNTQPIGGTITFATENVIPSINELTISGLKVYNAHINTIDYGFATNQFDPYVCQTRTTALNNISTLLGNTDRYRIEASTKSWLLTHSDGSNYWEPRFSFYNKSNTLLSTVKLDFTLEYGPSVSINSYTNNGGNVRINCGGAHGLQIGDIIEVFDAIPSYLGIASVISVESTTQVTINRLYTINGLLGAENLKKITGGGYEDYYFPVGLDQLLANTNTTLLSGSALSAVSSTVDYYKVELQKDGQVNTNPIYFELNDDCSRYEIFHLMWKDRYGSWLSYPFKYISEDTTEVERKNYYQTEGRWNLDNNTFGYDPYGRGEKTYFLRSRDSYKVNSGWVEEFENTLMKDLMESASVYVQLPNGTLLGAQIKNKDIQLRKKQSDYLWNYSFELNVSNNEVRL
jgi:hypothetical protein